MELLGQGVRAGRAPGPGWFAVRVLGMVRRAALMPRKTLSVGQGAAAEDASAMSAAAPGERVGAVEVAGTARGSDNVGKCGCCRGCWCTRWC